MNLTPIQSTNLQAVGYDPQTQTLEVLFHSGRRYGYSSVPAAVSEGLMRAASHGSYFHRHIRTSYPYRRIS